MTDANDREVYPNSPLVLVAAEIRHPKSTPIDGPAQAQLKRALAQVLPISKPAQRVTVTTTGSEATKVIELAPRFLSRNGKISATFFSEALILETTSYTQFEDFLSVANLVLSARNEAGSLDGIERVGLRYIDEIRVPQDGGISWSDWVSPTLLGPHPLAAGLRLEIIESQGLMVFASSGEHLTYPGSDENEHRMVLRYGPGEGYAIELDSELRRSSPAPGPYFLVDIDSFWTAGATTPEFNELGLTTLLSGLHAPVRALFESLITDRLREEVLRGNKL